MTDSTLTHDDIVGPSRRDDLDHLRPDVPVPGDRQGAAAADRPRGHRAGGRLGAAGDAGARPGRGGAGGGRADDRPALRHDDRGGLRAALGVLRGRHALDRDPSAEPARAAGDDDRPGRRAVGVPGQRRGLRRDDAAGAGPLPTAEPAAGPLPDRPGDRVEHRVGRDDHGQPAEHHHRQPLGHHLRALRRPAGAGGRAGAIDRLRRPVAALLAGDGRRRVEG